mmetsp:Transcript_5188/g.12748  ORF Transcript_5188/g.12748 Transcript_5188/m.12748 type:complete len:90 (+) Transcript_5188:53-322(+)
MWLLLIATVAAEHVCAPACPPACFGQWGTAHDEDKAVHDARKHMARTCLSCMTNCLQQIETQLGARVSEDERFMELGRTQIAAALGDGA